MYNVTLVNLTADARAVAIPAHIEQRDVGNTGLLALLRNFCEIDPVENASAATEIRIKVRQESYLIRTEQKKLVLYDVHHREIPGQLFTLEQVMPELDGTAMAARNQAIVQARAAAEPGETAPVGPVRTPPAALNKPRLIGLTVAVGLLVGAILYVNAPFAVDDSLAEFIPVKAPDLAELQASLTGVYLTGNEPGQHGIVVMGPGELKLFEMGAVEAPRMAYASYTLGRVGPKLSLATNQPGGIIEVGADGSLVYCGEVYRRIP